MKKLQNPIARECNKTVERQNIVMRTTGIHVWKSSMAHNRLTDRYPDDKERLSRLPSHDPCRMSSISRYCIIFSVGIYCKNSIINGCQGCG